MNVEDHMSVEDLRREFRIIVDEHYALLDALRDAPEMAPVGVLKTLGAAARYPEDSGKGKELRRQQYGFDAIPPVSECESGAGLWFRIRSGLVPAGAGR